MSADENRTKGFLWILLGGACAASVGVWPAHAGLIQMALYTVAVFGPLVLATWGDRHQRRFGTWMALAIILHCGVLYLIRSIFPFRTILSIIPLVLIEFVILFILMLKVTGQSDAEPDS